VTIDLSRSTTSSSLTFGLGGLRWATACSSGFFGACAEVDGAGGGGGLAPPAAVVLGPLGGNGTADAPGAIEMRLPVFGAGSGGGATKSKRGERCCKKAGGKKKYPFWARRGTRHRPSWLAGADQGRGETVHICSMRKGRKKNKDIQARRQVLGQAMRLVRAMRLKGHQQASSCLSGPGDQICNRWPPACPW